MVFFSGGMTFALNSVRLSAFVLLLLSRCFVRVALLFGPLAPRLAGSTAFSLEEGGGVVRQSL